MDRDNIKWLIAGLAGALLTVTLFVGAGVLIYLNLDKDTQIDPAPALVSVAEAKALETEEEDQEAKEEAEAAARSAALAEQLGLKNIYTPVYLLPRTRYALYHDKNFKQVEEDLASLLANSATPFDQYRYFSMISSMSDSYSDEDLNTLIKIIDEWIAASPDSYLPYLIGGGLKSNLAWEYRGTDYAYEVSRANMNKFQQLSKLAIQDLEKAQSMNASDPEIPAALAAAAAPVEGLATLRRYYDQTLALNPQHLGVRYTMATYLLPQWYGSWKKFDQYMAEIETASEQFPLLYEVKRDHSTFLEDRGAEYKGLWDSNATLRRTGEAFKAQLEQNPGELTLMASAAYYAMKTGDLKTAAGYFDQIGNRYPVVDEFPSMYNYHWWRVNTMVEYSDDPEVIGTPREKELLDAARALEPNNSTTNGFYLAYLARTRDDDQTRSFWDSMDDGFYKSGVLGTPPDYTQLRAMGLAARSDDIGVQGTEKERPLLEEAFALAPDNAYVRLVYAEYFITAKNYDEGRIHLERARELDPDYLPALHTMGWLNYHQKRWDEGIAAATEFLTSGTSSYVTSNADDAKDIIAACEKKKKKAAESL